MISPLLLFISICSSQLLIDESDYSLKISANDLMLIEALNDAQVFLIAFSPYDWTLHSRQCSMIYNHSNHYIYSIDIGQKQTSNQLHFFFAGEISSKKNISIGSETFIGILTKKRMAKNDNHSIDCTDFEYHSLQMFSSYDHQEYFVFTVEPYGQYAIGLAKDFLFIYRPFSDQMMTIKNSNMIWSSNTTFLPVAVDSDTSYTIVTGFLLNDPLLRVRATPTVYVLSNKDLSVLSSWSYTAVVNSWQWQLTYSNLKKWSNRYIMSVNINPSNSSQVLIGMPFLNIVFFLSVTSNGKKIQLDSYVDNGDSRGFGKSVTWLDHSQVAILHPSKIFLYQSFPSIPSVIFPNIHQSFPIGMNKHLIGMLSTPKSLILLTINGETLIISPTSPGYFPSTSLSLSESIFFESQAMLCMAGTYKWNESLFPCSLCPSGTYNPGLIPCHSCIDCSAEMFCPMGSVIPIDRSELLGHSQAYVHPRSPEVTVFDEILLQNMFSTTSGDNCMFISPLFWVSIAVGLVLLILLMMGILKRYVKHPRSEQLRSHVKRIFRQTDLIHEGEMWIGGMVSFAVLIFFIFAYVFSAGFYAEYPNENGAPWIFTCGKTIRNVKYESGLHSLSIPASREELPIFDLLNRQTLTFHLDLLNTVASCQSLAVEQLSQLSNDLVISSCKNSNGILSATVRLTDHQVRMKWIVNDIALVGAVRIGLKAEGKADQSYRLKELDFRQTIFDPFNRTLAQSATIKMELTKAINETEPLSGHHSKYSGLWYPTLTVDDNQMFLSSQSYATSANQTSMRLTILISETSYYIKNRQLPIAKLREIIFHNLLFTIVCLEIFRLVILFCKLTIVPLIKLILKHHRKTKQSQSVPMETMDQPSVSDEQQTTTDYPSELMEVESNTIAIKDHNVIEVN